MFQMNEVITKRWRIFGALCLACLLCLAVTSIAAAQDEPELDEEGCSCHTAERDSWEMSTHGQILDTGGPVAACQTCHGAYTRGHPDEDMIPLDADSSACIECHEPLAHNWEDTVHAEAGVQCIGCHQAHSQELRLDSKTLCESCHRDSLQDSLHTAHWLGDVACTDCHMADRISAVGGQIAAIDPAAMLLTAPRHDFVAVASDNCLDCHTKQMEIAANTIDTEFAGRLDVLEAAATAPELRAELSQAEQAARTTTFFVPMSLGFGVSLGGVLGIAFVLFVARWGRKGGM